MKLHLLPFVILLLLVVFGQCAERQARRHVRGGTFMEKRWPKWMKKVFRKKSKSSKSRLNDIEPIGLEQNMASSGASVGNTLRGQAKGRKPDENPRKGWKKWNYKDDANSRRGSLPKNWDSWEDNEVAPSGPSIGDTPKRWETWMNKQ